MTCDVPTVPVPVHIPEQAANVPTGVNTGKNYTVALGHCQLQWQYIWLLSLRRLRPIFAVTIACCSSILNKLAHLQQHAYADAAQ